jgi:hypothetical protein
LKLRIFRRSKEEPDTNAEVELALGSSLRDLCAGDEELYKALEHFLLFNPKMILENLGNVPYWMAKADTAKSKGNNLVAAMDYETAARIACYENDKEATRKALAFAEGINPQSAEAALDRVLISKLDKVFEISAIHYSIVSNAEKEREQAKKKKLLTAASASAHS